MKKIISSLLAIIMIVAVLPLMSNEVHADNSIIDIELGKTVFYKATYSGSNDVYEKCYRFRTTDEWNYGINIADGCVAIQVEFLDENFRPLDNSEIFSSVNPIVLSRSQAGCKLYMHLKQNSEYFIRIKPNKSLGDEDWYYGFAFKVDKGPLRWNELDSVEQDGKSMATAIEVDINKPFEFEKVDFYERWYKFKTSSNPGSIYHFNLSPNDEHWDVKLFALNHIFRDGGQDAKITGGEEYDLENSSVCYLRVETTEPRGGVITVSEIVDRTKPKAPFLQLSAYGRTLSILWDAVDGASKYQVAYKEKTSRKWTYYTTKNSGEWNKYLYNLKRGKYYTVMVRAIKIVNGEAIYGVWSKSQTVQMPK